MPNYRITGSEIEEINFQIGQLIQHKETAETWLVGTFYGCHNEKNPELYAMNLQTGILERLDFENNFNFKPLHPDYKIILSNGHISENDY